MMDRDLIRFYGFARPPFGPITGPAHLFNGGPHAAIARDVLCEVHAGRVIMAVRGEQGAGKTTLMHLLAWELQAADVLVVRVNAAMQSPAKVQRMIGEAGIIEGGGLMEPTELLRALRSRRGVERLVLLIDDAHTLSEEMFRYLWLLTQLFHLGKTELSIVLLGEMRPWPALASVDLQDLRQAMFTPHVIAPLREHEAAAYLDRKLRYAGRSLRRVMTKAAMLEMFEQAGGVPARLEAATERVLLNGFARGHKRITVQRLRQVFPKDDMMIAPAATGRGAKVLMASGLAVVFVVVLAATIALVERAGPFSGFKPSFAAADRPHLVLPSAGQGGQGEFLPRYSVPDIVGIGKAGTDQRLPAPGIAPVPPVAALPDQAEQQVAPPESPSLPGSAAQDGARLAAAPPGANGAANDPITDRRGGAEAPESEGATPAVSASALPGHLAAPPGPEVQPPDSAPDTTAIPAPGSPPEAAVAASNQAPVSPDAEASSMAERPMAAHEPSPADPAVSPSSGSVAEAPSSEDGVGRATPPVSGGNSTSPAIGAPGLVVVASNGDSMATLYAKVYRGLKPPPYPEVVAINRLPVKPGDLVIFPQPPDGWSSRTN